jgi:3-methyl-2-oxobutanoate hydroxymethyltransferase
MSGKVTILEVQAMQARGEKIVMLTAYDYPSAMIADACGIDMILVGDSVGTVIQGVATTLPVTMEQMLYHTELVTRARQRAMVVFDMPFMSYQESIEQAKRNAGLAVKVAGAEAVKLEGGSNMAEVIEAIAGIDIPVVGHIGLTPQSIHRMGGHKVQGKTKEQRRKLLSDAKSVEKAGAFCLVMECIPAPLAKEITASVKIPTIGIGCGPHCSGQVLVWHDILGVYPGRKMTMVKRFADLNAVISEAVSAYAREVREGKFPGPEHCFGPAPAQKPAPRGPQRRNKAGA